MRIGDKNFKLKTKHGITLDLEDGSRLPLEVSAMPLDYDSIRDRLFPMPAIPKRMIQNARGAVLRDPKSNEVLFEEDDTPGETRDKIERASRNQQVLMVYLALRDSVVFDSANGLDFDAQPEAFKDVVDAVAAELKASGFGTGHLVRIQKAALEASGITEELLDRARRSFS